MAPPKSKSASKTPKSVKTQVSAPDISSSSDELSKKDRAALTNVSKLYDEKKYKKALKDANDFLKIHPTNIDCQCFKTLIVYKLDQKQEAHDLAKTILRSNLSSFTAWHTLGFLHRQDKNYAEALKCFKTASRFNKDSAQILKDLSLVQIYQRDLVGLKDTYKTLIQLQSSYKGHWIGLTLTNHLLGNFAQACEVFDGFFSILDPAEIEGLKYTELMLYKCMILEEMGKYDEVLTILKENEKKLLDKQFVKQKMGEVLIKKNSFNDAEKIFKELLKVNSENILYHQKLWESKQIQSLDNLNQDQIKVLSDLYDSLSKEYPKSLMCQKIPLRFLDANSEKFRETLIKYTKHFLIKGIPSLFNNLKSLYGNAEKVAVIEKLFLDHLASLNNEPSTLVGSTDAEAPSTTLWVLYYLTYHFDRLGKSDEAFKYLDMALKHTPTSVDLYTTKAKLLKHRGELDTAASTYESARKMDMADRYLNTKSTLYALRNDDIAGSEQIFSQIIDKSDGFMKNITDFQCTWYEKEAGKAYMRQGEYGKALKMLYLVDKHFNEFIDDQFDFHNHVQKKLTLRSYIQFLRWEDNIYKNKPYHDAAILIVKIYLILLKKPWVPKPEDPVEVEKREQLAKKRKESPTYDTEGNIIEFDDDPHGDKMASVADVLAPAAKFMDNLLKFNPDSIPVHELATQYYLEKKDYSTVLKSLLKLKKECPENPIFHRNLVQFFTRVDSDKEIKDDVKQSIESSREELLGEKSISLAQYNEKYEAAHKDSVAHRFVVAESLFNINANAKSQALAKMMDLSGVATWKNCQENLDQIKLLFGDEESKKYREICLQKFPNVKCFKEPVVAVVEANASPAAEPNAADEPKVNGTQ